MDLLRCGSKTSEGMGGHLEETVNELGLGAKRVQPLVLELPRQIMCAELAEGVPVRDVAAIHGEWLCIRVEARLCLNRIPFVDGLTLDVNEFLAVGLVDGLTLDVDKFLAVGLVIPCFLQGCNLFRSESLLSMVSPWMLMNLFCSLKHCGFDARLQPALPPAS